jgi:hypothetical protein
VDDERPALFMDLDLPIGIENPLRRDGVVQERDEQLGEEETTLVGRIARRLTTAPVSAKRRRPRTWPQLGHPHTKRAAHELARMGGVDGEAGWRWIREEILIGCRGRSG